MTIEVDRSRIIAYQRCPRERFLAYHIHNKGLQRRAKALPLVTGSAFHEGAVPLLHNDIEQAVTVAIDFLNEAFKGHGVGMDGETVTDQSIVYSAQEQMALTEALIRAWGLERLPEFLSTFEIVEVEKEGRSSLTEEVHCASCNHVHYLGEHGETCPHCACTAYQRDPELVLMFRPDALVRDKLSGDHYVVSWKTAATYNKRTLKQSRHAMQSVTEIWGRLNSENPPPEIQGNIYLYVVKGKRMEDDWDQLWKQQTHLIYGWRKLKLADEFDNEWSWSFKYPKDDGSGNSTLGKGWKKVPIWSEYPGGVKAWIEGMHNREIFPRHVDPFESVFPQMLPIERNRAHIESWKRQTVEQELNVARMVSMIGTDPDIDDLDRCFPQYTHSCDSYSGCAFTDICHEGVAAEPGELYTIRSANHPESSDEEE